MMVAAVLVVLVESVGLVMLRHFLVIPDGRMGAAQWVLQCSMATLVINVLATPYNAAIIAHEKMDAFAMISIVEATLKLAVALLLYVSGFDKLKTYALLMLGVALIVRSCYAGFCRRHFEETRGKASPDRSLLREMSGFAGWSVLNSGIFMFNTQGLNILTNIFFGVVANAARGVAVQVEGIVKMFVNNVVTAINPQITKSYAAGNREYSFSLAFKGAKYAALIVMFFAIPALFEADTILRLWLGTVPEGAALFTKLTLLCTMLDMMFTSSSTLVFAEGQVGRYYRVVCSLSILIFPLTWIAFRLGSPVWSAYAVFLGVYVVLDAVKLILLHRITGASIHEFHREVIYRIICPAAASVLASGLVVALIHEPTWWRALLTVAASSLAMAVAVLFTGLTKGERDFVIGKILRRK